MNTGKMKTTEKEFLHKELTGDIINSAFAVHSVLGCGLLEKSIAMHDPGIWN